MHVDAIVGLLPPTDWGDLFPLNFATWVVIHVLADTKFITTLSMLFGASILIMGKLNLAKRMGGVQEMHGLDNQNWRNEPKTAQIHANCFSVFSFWRN